MSGFIGANDKDQGRENEPADDWREPPGYLGEAVRRAKLISGRRPERARENTED